MNSEKQNFGSDKRDGCESIRPFGFFRSFFAACSGTAPFELLSCHSLARLACHLVILSILLSGATGYFLLKSERPRLSAAEQLFEETFGSKLSFCNGSVVPEKSVDTPRTLVLPGTGTLYYLPSVNSPVPERKDLNDLPYICVWTPGAITLASVSGENSWFVSRWEAKGISNFSTADTRDIFKFISQESEAGASGFTMSVAEFFDVIVNACFIRSLIIHFFSCFILPLIYSTILLLVVKFSIGRITAKPEPLRWWKTGVYASFPGLLVGSCITAFHLPFISFSTACMASTLVYGLHIILRMEYKKNNRIDGADNGKNM